MRISIIGRTRLIYDAIRPLIEAGNVISNIITCKACAEYDRNESDFEKLAADLDIPFLLSESINSRSALAWIKQHPADIGISANWKNVIGAECRSLFEHGIINVHIGDLPRYRGNATPNWAIINGEPEIVLTFHQMVDELDAGPIVLQEKIPVSDDTYIGNVYNESFRLTAEMAIDVVRMFEDGTARPRKQDADPTHGLRCYPRIPEDSEIDWRQPALEIHRLIRASSEPYQGAYTFLKGNKLIIWRATSEPVPTPYLGTPGQVASIDKERGEVKVLTADGFICLQVVQPVDGLKQEATKAIKSARTRLGMNAISEINAVRQTIKKGCK